MPDTETAARKTLAQGLLDFAAMWEATATATAPTEHPVDQGFRAGVKSCASSLRAFVAASLSDGSEPS